MAKSKGPTVQRVSKRSGAALTRSADSRSARIAELRRLLAEQSYHVDLDELAERVAKDVLRRPLWTRH